MIRTWLEALAIALVGVLVIGAMLMIFLARALGAQDVNPWLRSWIPPQCCVTQDCCFEIAPGDVIQLPDDQWRIVASGQVLRRSGWSKDWRYWRCACDLREGRWTVHPTAYTYCIFVPPPAM